MLRFSQRLTKAGPVATFEQLRPGEGKPLGVRVGFAQGIRINGNTVAKFGFRTTQMGERKVDWGKTDFGLILAGKGFSAQAHYLGEKKTAAYSVGVPVGKSVIDVAHMEPAFFSKGSAIRIGVSNLEKTLGINLGKLSTNMGLTFPEGEKRKVDVTLIWPKKFGDAVGEYYRTIDGEDIFAGALILRF